MRRLALDDIADARAYERERAQFRDRVNALKKKRRVAVGPFVTLVFENRDTIRFQIQEMARVEKLYSDEAILHELDTYNPLIPDGTNWNPVVSASGGLPATASRIGTFAAELIEPCANAVGQTEVPTVRSHSRRAATNVVKTTMQPRPASGGSFG